MKDKQTNTINRKSKKTMTVSELRGKLKEQLESHDWFYEFSDDNRYYEAGQQEFLDIWKTIEDMKEFGENEFDLAIEMFKLHKPIVETPIERSCAT
jgi:hypothetical protein